ncbi:MAG: hypothetical protein QM740_17400 [Acidovorax sp.]
MSDQPSVKTPRRGKAAAAAKPLADCTAANPLFEALLDLDAARQRSGKLLFKIPTFEDLFDERAARTLGRLGIIQMLGELRAQVAALERRVAVLEAAAPQQQPSQKPRARRASSGAE